MAGRFAFLGLLVVDVLVAVLDAGDAVAPVVAPEALATAVSTPASRASAVLPAVKAQALAKASLVPSATASAADVAARADLSARLSILVLLFTAAS